MEKKGFVYLIQSSKNNSVYVGSTFDVLKRLGQHNAGAVRSTHVYRPYALVRKEEYSSIHEARVREKEIKSKRFVKTTLIKALSSNG